MVEGGPAALGLAQRLSEMQTRVGDAVVGGAKDTETHYRVLVGQLAMLAEFIGAARQEIAAVGASDIVGRDVPAATDQLDAVILHTAEATGRILDECEKLELAVEASPLRATVTEATARIYEACSFQDITGQRVAKVVQTLRVIELKVGDMLRVFGCGPSAQGAAPGPAALLNGPQRSGDAMEQQEVDALLASFD